MWHDVVSQIEFHAQPWICVCVCVRSYLFFMCFNVNKASFVSLFHYFWISDDHQNTLLPSALHQISHKLTVHLSWVNSSALLQICMITYITVMNQTLSQTRTWCCAKYSTWPTEGCGIRIDSHTRQNLPAMTDCDCHCLSCVLDQNILTCTAATLFSHGSIYWSLSLRL